MNIQQLKFFQAITRNEHITSAAQELFISEPALSLSMKRLENELGIKLFDRVGRSIVISQQGKIFSKYVDEVLYLMHNAKSEMELLEGQDSNSKDILKSGAGVPGFHAAAAEGGEPARVTPRHGIALRN